jgi:4-amino-4-deoxy-L-arabinose transferase-like glycosyltransferase
MRASQPPEAAARHPARFSRWGLVVFLLALLIRLLFFWGNIGNPLYYFPILDEAWYVQVAKLLVHGQGHDLVAFMDPLYAWWLAGWFRAGAGLFAIRVTQLVVDSASAWLVYRLGRELWSQRAGLVAGVLYAGYGTAVFFAPLLLKVTLLNALLLASAWLLVIAVKRGQTKYWIGGGVLVALVIWLRANFFLLLALVPLLLLLEHRKAPPVRSGIAAWLLAAAVCVLIGGFAMQQVTGEFHLLPKAGGYVLYITNHAGNPRGEHRPPAFVKSDNPAEMDRFFQAEAERRAGHPFTTAQSSRYWMGQTLAYWADNPLALPRTMGWRLLQWLSAYEIPNNYNFVVAESAVPWLAWLPGWGIALGLGLPGLAWAVCTRRGAVLLAPTLAVLATGLLFFVTARLRLPAVPFLLVGAGVLAEETFRGLCTAALSRSLGGAWAGGAVLAAVALWLPHAPPDTEVERYNRVVVLLRMHQTTTARNEAERLVAERPDNAKYLFALGNAMLQQKAYVAAADQYRKTLGLDPGNAAVWHNLGMARLGESQLPAARDAFAEALKRDRDPLTLLMLGQVYDRMHRPSGAYVCYSAAVKSGMLPALKARQAQAYLQQIRVSEETSLPPCQ